MVLVLAAGGTLSIGIWVASLGAIGGAFGPTDRLLLFRGAVLAGLSLIVTGFFVLALLLSERLLSSLWVTPLALVAGFAASVIAIAVTGWAAVHLGSPAWALTASVPIAVFVFCGANALYAILGRCSGRRMASMVALSLLFGVLSVGAGELSTLRHSSELDLLKVPTYALLIWLDSLASWSIACSSKQKVLATLVMLTLNLIGISVLFVVQR